MIKMMLPGPWIPESKAVHTRAAHFTRTPPLQNLLPHFPPFTLARFSLSSLFKYKSPVFIKAHAHLTGLYIPAVLAYPPFYPLKELRSD